VALRGGEVERAGEVGDVERAVRAVTERGEDGRVVEDEWSHAVSGVPEGGRRERG
jgi:hypothetical protein